MIPGSYFEKKQPKMMFKKSGDHSLHFTPGPQSVFYTDHLNLSAIYSFDSISVQAEPTSELVNIVFFCQTVFLCANICLNTCIS